MKGLIGLVLAVISVVGLVVIGVAIIFLNLPDVRTLKGCLTTEMFHVHLCKNDADFTSLDEISPYVVGAVIMSEDASFLSHKGVDIEEMKESFKKDLNEGRFARGASTITQQLAKNIFLTKSKSLIRKGEEIYLALQIEKYFSKQEILTYYLNVVEFAQDLYGINHAAQFYFKKSPRDLTPEEAAFLIMLLPNPEKYGQSFRKRQLTPYANKTVRTILHKMLLGHKLEDYEYQAAVSRVPTIFSGGAETPLPGLAPAAAGDQMESPTGTTSDPNGEGSQGDDEFQFEFNSNQDSSDKH